MLCASYVGSISMLDADAPALRCRRFDGLNETLEVSLCCYEAGITSMKQQESAKVEGTQKEGEGGCDKRFRPLSGDEMRTKDVDDR